MPAAPGDEPPYWEEPVPLSDVAPPAVRIAIALVAGSASRSATTHGAACGGAATAHRSSSITPHRGSSGSAQCGGPPAVPLAPQDCANAKVPDSANADANRIVASFMADSFLLRKDGKPQRRRAMRRGSPASLGCVRDGRFVGLCESGRSTIIDRLRTKPKSQ